MEDFNDIDFSQFLKDMNSLKDFDFLPFTENAPNLTPVSNTQAMKDTSSSDKDRNLVSMTDVTEPTLAGENTLNSCAVSNKKATKPASSSHQLVPNTKMKPVLVNCINKEKTSSAQSLNENTKRLYACSVCNRTFVRHSLLQKHEKIHHEKISCKECLKTFLSRNGLKRHLLLHNKESTQLFKCKHCGYKYTRIDQLNYHLKCYQKSAYACTYCNEKFCRKISLNAHIRERHARELLAKKSQTDNCKMQNTFSITAFKCCKENNVDITVFLNSLKLNIKNELLHQMNKKKKIKFFLTIEGDVTNSSEQDNAEIFSLFIDSNVIYIFSENDIPDYIDKTFTEIVQQFFQLKAKWTIKKIIRLTVCTINYNAF